MIYFLFMKSLELSCFFVWKKEEPTELQSNQVKMPFRIHKLIIWKVNPFVPSVTCTQCQTAFKWTANFWLHYLVYDEMENISMDEISI